MCVLPQERSLWHRIFTGTEALPSSIAGLSCCLNFIAKPLWSSFHRDFSNFPLSQLGLGGSRAAEPVLGRERDRPTGPKGWQGSGQVPGDYFWKQKVLLCFLHSHLMFVTKDTIWLLRRWTSRSWRTLWKIAWSSTLRCNTPGTRRRLISKFFNCQSFISFLLNVKFWSYTYEKCNSAIQAVGNVRGGEWENESNLGSRRRCPSWHQVLDCDRHSPCFGHFNICFAGPYSRRIIRHGLCARFHNSINTTQYSMRVSEMMNVITLINIIGEQIEPCRPKISGWASFPLHQDF